MARLEKMEFISKKKNIIDNDTRNIEISHFYDSFIHIIL